MQSSTLEASSDPPDDLLFSPAHRMVEERDPESGLFSVAKFEQAERAASLRGASEDDAGSGLVNVAELLKQRADAGAASANAVAPTAPIDLNAPDPSSPNDLPDAEPTVAKHAWFSPQLVVLGLVVLLAALAAVS